MATDNNELTFVRCPSCRSLIPAVSTRCRMCGASLDSTSERPEEPAQKPSARVRQRTMSTAGDAELEQTRDRIREDEVVSATQQVADVSNDDPMQLDDPLSAYIEELEVEIPDDSEGEMEDDSIVAIGAEDETPQFAGAEEEESEESGGYADFEPREVEDVETRFDYGGVVSEIRSDPESGFVEGVSAVEDDDAEEVVNYEVNEVEGGLVGPFDFNVGEEEEEVTVEDLGDDSSEEIEDVVSSQESVVEDVEFEIPEIAAEVQQTPERTSRSARRRRDNRSSNPDKQQRSEQQSRKEGRSGASEKESVARYEENESEEKKRFERREKQQKNVSQQGKDRKQNAPFQKKDQTPQRAPSKKGRLFGWFVSYNTPSGEGIELREGKFFITRTSLKGTDLILEDESISTPHAMVMVSTEDGLRLHDLMSDRGIFVRRRGDNTYQKEEELVILENGDWVRFGDVEFLVTLIPYVGEK